MDQCRHIDGPFEAVVEMHIQLQARQRVDFGDAPRRQLSTTLTELSGSSWPKQR